MVTFGLLNVVGGAVSGPKAWFPALVIGGLWALIGWRGFPLISSIPPDSHDVAAGARSIRRRRFVFWMPLTALLCVPAVLFTPEQFRMTAFLACAIPSATALAVLIWSACPRREKHFFLNGWRSSWTNQCVHCGQSLDAVMSGRGHR
jgi:hypothetical protein